MTDECPIWMVLEEAATYVRCSERFLREELMRVPHTKWAGRALFHRARLDEWLFGMEVNIQTGGTAMIEMDMEQLLAKYPEDFFDERLTLVSQQEVFPSGITDLIFADRQGDLLVVEIKRGVLQREHIGQIVDYLEAVEEKYGNKHVELMLIANVIPRQRRTKLERIGVNFKEIPESKFLDVAKKHGVEIETTSVASSDQDVPVDANCPRDNVSALVQELIDFSDKFVKGLGLNLKKDLEESDYAKLTPKTFARLSRWCHPRRASKRENRVKPRAHQISEWLFGRVIDRVARPSYR